MSLASVITAIENAVSTTESDVQAWVAKIQAAIPVLEADLTYGLKWVASVAPGWVAGLQDVLLLAQAIPGLQIPAAAILATSEAAAALTAVAAAETAGQTNGATLVAAYNAVVNAKAAQAAILQTVTTAPTPTPVTK